jgi:hypothetical protein
MCQPATDADYDRVMVPVIERAKAEIRADIAAGGVPPTVACFADLHNHVDANEYGGATETDPDTGEGWWDGDEADRRRTMDFWNRVQAELDTWLRNGRS